MRQRNPENDHSRDLCMRKEISADENIFPLQVAAEVTEARKQNVIKMLRPSGPNSVALQRGIVSFREREDREPKNNRRNGTTAMEVKSTAKKRSHDRTATHSLRTARAASRRSASLR